MTLTVKKVDQLREPGRYGDGYGLYLQVLGPTNRSWLFRYERDGRERWMGLGPLHTFNLEEARERARLQRQLLKDGIDPLEQRKAKRGEQALEAAKTMTFEAAARQYHDQHKNKWRNAKHRAQFISTLETYAFPVVGKLAVPEIDMALVLKVLERNHLWAQKTETASRLRGRIEAVLDWATVRGYRTGDNPAQWKLLAKALPARGQIRKVQHHAALPYTDIPGFMAQLAQREGVAVRALEFLILTAARTGEIIGGRWSEIDRTHKLWVVPAERMKAGRPHRVPLSDRALKILDELPCEGDALFVGSKASAHMSNMAMAMLLKRVGREDITVHGFRSTFRDWAAEQTSYPNHVVEMALAHTIGDKVEAAYRRGDLLTQRARLMAEWARYCYAPQQPRATVTPIRAGVQA
jgi:integrase